MSKMTNEMESGYQQPMEKNTYLFKLTNLNYETWAPNAMKHLLVFPDSWEWIKNGVEPTFITPPLEIPREEQPRQNQPGKDRRENVPQSRHPLPHQGTRIHSRRLFCGLDPRGSQQRMDRKQGKYPIQVWLVPIGRHDLPQPSCQDLGQRTLGLRPRHIPRGGQRQSAGSSHQLITHARFF